MMFLSTKPQAKPFEDAGTVTHVTLDDEFSAKRVEQKICIEVLIFSVEELIDDHQRFIRVFRGFKNLIESCLAICAECVHVKTHLKQFFYGK